jgi:uncharacterized protein
VAAMLFGLEDVWQLLIVFLAAILAGAGNAVAGGGTNLSFPILVWAGLPPVQANATNAVGLSSGSVAAAWSYRARIRDTDPRWWWLLLPGAVGGGIGAWLLLSLPPEWFGAIAPLLVIGGAVLVGLDPVLRRHLAIGGGNGSRAAIVMMLLVSFYGGYFGAGIGILILVVLSLLGMDDLHQANGFKNMLTVAVKGVAVIIFIVQGEVIWGAAIVLLAGSMVGGWCAGHLIQKVEPATLRWMVVAMGVIMGTVMVTRTYLL